MYIVYGKPSCTFCDQAKALLDASNKVYSYIDVSEDKEAFDFLVSQGHRSVPQVYVRATNENATMSHVGGFTELRSSLER